MVWLISTPAREVMLAHAEEAHPHEACGLLLGHGKRVAIARPAANVAPDRRRRFEIDPAMLLAAQRIEREGGPAVLGYYHSHPGGDAVPSKRDAERAMPDGRLWLILARGEIGGYVVEERSENAKFRAVGLSWTE